MMKAESRLEAAWVALCKDAGWTDDLYCTADGRARAAYEARLDALAAEREGDLRAMIAAIRQDGSSAYADGIEAALNRAIMAPRSAR